MQCVFLFYLQRELKYVVQQVISVWRIITVSSSDTFVPLTQYAADRPISCVGHFRSGGDLIVAVQLVPIYEDPHETALLHISDVLQDADVLGAYDFICALDGFVEVLATWRSFEDFALQWGAETDFRSEELEELEEGDGEAITLLGLYEDTGELCREVVWVEDIDDEALHHFFVARNVARYDIYGNYKFLMSVRGDIAVLATMDTLATYVEESESQADDQLFPEAGLQD
jgi:hypothetical protein